MRPRLRLRERKWFVDRRLRKRWLIPLVAALAGGMVVLLVERFVLPPKPPRLPVIISNTSSAPPLTPLAPHELETRIRINPCIDLYSYVCTLARTEDPTGDVRRDAEGEVEALRIYENIIRTHHRLSPEKVDELLVKRVYTAERTRRIRELFHRAQNALLKFIDSQPFQALSVDEKQELKNRVSRVQLELPPPASVYADEPDLFTRNDVYYERTPEGRVRIRIGGALFFTVRSQFNLAFTLAHEIGHSIDPCELHAEKIDILAYSGLAECFGTPRDTLDSECSARGKISEIFADWIASHVVADLLVESAVKFTPAQIRAAVFSTVRDLCREEDDDPNEVEAGLTASHPNVSFRVNGIFAQHPKIRHFLGCQDAAGPLLPGVPAYCFWPARREKSGESK